jgi:hypothetical protein
MGKHTKQGLDILAEIFDTHDTQEETDAAEHI